MSDSQKTAVIFGLANKRSIAWAIAKKLHEAGWRLAGRMSVVGAVRYSRARASFGTALSDPVTLGGVHIGGGIRLVF